MTAERKSLFATRTDANGENESMLGCPCGAQVQEWLTYDGPDVVEHELCPMCAEDDRHNEGWWQ